MDQAQLYDLIDQACGAGKKKEDPEERTKKS
jgi:hypothetical protein